MYTEFISSEGLIREGKKSVQKLDVFDYDRPIGIQLYGNVVDSMVDAARVAEKARPDIIDINFGCPVKKIANRGAGAGLLRDLPLMIELTEAIVKTVDVPVTVKTRLGWDEKDMPIVDLAQRLQDVGIAALTIHGRTRAQMYKGKADWTLIGEVKNHPNIQIPVIGNGDIDSPQAARYAFDQYGVDGIMIGRASVGNPWIFRDIRHYLKTGEILPPPTVAEKTVWAKTHLQKSIHWKGLPTGIFEMRKHLSNYFKGLPHFKEIRMKLVTSNDPDELYSLLDQVQDEYGDTRVPPYPYWEEGKKTE